MVKKAQLPEGERAMHYVCKNVVNCCTTVRKIPAENACSRKMA